MKKHTLQLAGVSQNSDAEPSLEQLYPVTELPARLPRKKGKKISYWTILRWCIGGTCGVKLRSLMIGKTRCTADVWVLSFFQQLTDGKGQPANKPSAGDHTAAMKELELAGV